MTLQQALRAEMNTTKDLFDRIEATSDNAVKTRENLYGDLSRELRLHTEIEQADLLPALRQNPEAKELANDAAKQNRELKAKLDELDALPKNEPSFRERIGELRKLFDQQARDERVASKALTDEQRKAVEDKVEKRRADAEEQRQAEDEQRKAESRREAEHVRAAASRKRAGEEVADATKRTFRDLQKSASEAVHNGAETAREAAEKVRHGADKTKDKVVGTARRVRDAATDTVSSYRDTAGESIQDLKTIGSAVRNFAKVGGELRTVLVESIKHTGRARIDIARGLLRDPLRYGELRREFARTRSRNRAETAAEVLQVVRSASTAARQPFEQRLRAVA
jgi:hypothetical protein